MHGCESWTMKKADHQRIDTSELWCWRKLFKVPWTARRSNQSILKEISPEYSLEGLMLRLKLQYFGHLRWKTNSLEKTLMLGRIEHRRRRVQQRMRWLDGPLTQWTWVWVSSGSCWWTGKPGVLQSMVSQRVQHDWATELNWTDGEKSVIFSPYGEKGQFLYSMDGSDKELEKKSLISQTYNEEMVSLIFNRCQAVSFM